MFRPRVPAAVAWRKILGRPAAQRRTTKHAGQQKRKKYYFFLGGTNLNIEDVNGRNCLHIAAYHGDQNLPKIINFIENIDAQVV